MMMILFPVCDSKLLVLQSTHTTQNTDGGDRRETGVTLAPPVSVTQVLHHSPPQCCSLIGSQRFGQAGHFLQTLVVGVLVVVMRFDQDHAGRPLGARRRSQILRAEQKQIMDQLFGTTGDASLLTPSNQITDSPLWRGCRRMAGSCLHTWRAGDSRRRWAACLQPGPRCCADARRSVRTSLINKQLGCTVTNMTPSSSPFLSFVDELLNLFHSSADVLHFGSWKEKTNQWGHSPFTLQTSGTKRRK